MSKSLKCSYCKKDINVNVEPIECHVCPHGHVLCEKCDYIARSFCFRCGGKTQRKLPENDIKELYRAPIEKYMKEIKDSRTLIIPETENSDSDDDRTTGKYPTNATPTVIGFRKWPRSFFHQIPDENDLELTLSEKKFLEILPQIIIQDEKPKRSTKAPPKANWDDLPKSFTDFEMTAEVLECPITRCKYPICNTDATRHILHSHDDIPIEILPRHSIADFVLDTMTARENETKALLRILVPGVVTDLGITKHRDCLPLLLLYTRVNILEADKKLPSLNVGSEHIYSETEEDSSIMTMMTTTTKTGTEATRSPETIADKDYELLCPWKSSDCLLIWCAGVVPLDHPITVAISLNPRDNRAMNIGAVIRVFSMHVRQSSKDIYDHTERLMISIHDLNRFTRVESVIEGQIRIM